MDSAAAKVFRRSSVTFLGMTGVSLPGVYVTSGETSSDNDLSSLIFLHTKDEYEKQLLWTFGH